MIKQEIIFISAYDKRHDDPKKNYGISSVRFVFVVSGKNQAVTLMFGTNWYLPSTIKEYREVGLPNVGKIDLIASQEPIKAWSIDSHSTKPLYKGQDSYGKCSYLGDKKCYCDGSSLRAEQYTQILLEKGSEGIFEELKKEYKSYFGGSKK